MRIFEQDGKTNFVDEKNVLVGYSTEQSCCEFAGWSITKSRPTALVEKLNEIAGEEADFIFDGAFIQENIEALKGEVSDGGTALFRLHAPGGQEAFLLLWNCHNGYYGHGFDMTQDGKTLFEGCI